MAGQKKSRFELKASGPWQLDPHLQELIRAQEAGPAISRAIASRPGVADVIVRLKDDARDKLPAALQKPRRIGGEQSSIVTGEIDIAAIKATRKEVASIKAATKLYLNLHNSVPTIHCDSASLDQAAKDDNGRTFPGLNGTDVIVGVVDFGCDFVHKNFRQPSGATRLLYLWDQSDPPPLDSSGAVSPDHFDYGRELNSTKINEALKTADPYTYLAYTPPLAAHGTHVMDIAAGNGREENLLGGVAGPASAGNPMSHPGVAPNAFLIFVHLKADGNQFLGNSRHLLEAVDYIFDKADRLGLPAVVNLSLSTSGGPHDGTTLVEQGFEELLKTPGRAIVVSAGNAYGQQGHVSGTIAGGGQTQTLKWNTNPRASRNEMEVWYPGAFKNLTVALIPPAEDTPLGAVPLGKTKDLYEGETRRGRISHRDDDPNNHDNQIDVRVPHLVDTKEPWQIVLSNGGAAAVTFHAWIEQDERGTAYFDEPTDNNFTLGSICCGEKTLTVGAFDTSEMACLAPPYPATAAGPTRPRGNPSISRLKPELSAPGNNIVAARAHGGTTVMSGTSMAAAHVTGLVALLFERAKRAGQGPLPIDTTRDVLMAAAKGSAVLSVNQDLRLGSGKIDGAGTLNELLSVAPPPPPLQGIAAAPPEAVPGPAPAKAPMSDLFRDLVDTLAQAHSFKVKVGNDGAPASEKLTELVGLLKQQDFELLVDPPA